LFCSLLLVFSSCFKREAAARHTIGLLGISKFAVPSLLLVPTGARLAFFWPAAPWLSSAVSEVSAMLNKVESLLSPNVATGTSQSVALTWAIGTVLMFVVWCVRIRRHNPRLAAPTQQEQTAITEASLLFPVGLPVQLRISDALEGPTVRGICRPLVTVPTGLSNDLTSSEFQSVLLHELAHAHRRDNLAGIFVRCLVCLFWFHPLLWIMERRLCAERERACDDLVLACGVRAHVYASCILKVCKFHLLGAAAAGISTMSASDLSRRLELILQDRIATRASYAPRVLIGALALLMTVIPLAGGYCSQCVSTGQQPASLHADATRWALSSGALPK
jgi:beta-lactamase regulating signal transducer with metallopeptidase domain